MPDDIICGPLSACKSIPGGGGGRDAISSLCWCEFLGTRCTCDVGVVVAEEEGATLHAVPILKLRKGKETCWKGGAALLYRQISSTLSGKMLCLFWECTVRNDEDGFEVSEKLGLDQ